jgi:hypothetical protein
MTRIIKVCANSATITRADKRRAPHVGECVSVVTLSLTQV